MAISAPGVGSNLDVSSIVSQLMTIEQRPRLLLDAKEAAFQAQLSAYGQLRGALSALESAVGGLADPARFEGRSASVGDSTVVSASAGAAAANATYEVAVTQLAQHQSLTTAGQASLTAPVGSGASTALTFEFGTISGGTLSAGVYTGASFAQNGSVATRTVTIDASNNSLQGIRDAINAANVGVTRQHPECRRRNPLPAGAAERARRQRRQPAHRRERRRGAGRPACLRPRGLPRTSRRLLQRRTPA